MPMRQYRTQCPGTSLLLTVMKRVRHCNVIHIDTLAPLQSNWTLGNEEVYLCIVGTRCASPTLRVKSGTRMALRINQPPLGQVMRYQ